MSDDSVYGFAGPVEIDDEVARTHFMIKHLLARHRTAMLVKVLKVYPGGYGTQNNGSPTTVDVKPMVKQRDAQSQSHSHDTIYGIPVPRFHHGAVAIMADPAVGDVGLMTVADRDHSSVLKNSGAESNPGSARRADMSDGMYWGTMFGPQPQNFIDMRGGNIHISTPGNLTHDVSGTMSMRTTGGPATYDDGQGNTVLLDMNNKKVCVIPADNTVKVYLGGDPAAGGVFYPVSTTGGPSDNVYAHVSGPTSTSSDDGT